jgi:transposase
LEGVFGGLASSRVALEVGTHSPWVSRLLVACGHEVVVANARRVRLISETPTKSDRLDAEKLARLARVDPKLLSPLQHRGEQVQADRALLRSRDALVQTRSRLIVHVRSLVKSWGERLPRCSAEAFSHRAEAHLPAPLRQGLEPILKTIGELTKRIRSYDQRIEELGKSCYAQSELLQQVAGVGALTAVAYMLTLENPLRFGSSRMVGAYLGLVPRQDQSGGRDPELRITKAGDGYTRRLLVQAAHYILGPFGPDTDLRRYGEAIAKRGGQNAKKRAVVAVARKLAVLLHHLWVTGEVYEPLYNSQRRKPRAQQTEVA